jgi:O-methyltransferase/methyltransferase family protein
MLRLAPQLLRVMKSSVRRGRWREFREVLLDGLSLSRGGGGPSGRPPALFEMATSYWISQVVYVTAELGVADVLKQGPKSCREIATETGADEKSLYRLLRALCTIGVIRRAGTDQFTLAARGRPLVSGVPGSLRAMVLTLGDMHYAAWGHLLESVRTGTSAFRTAFGAPLFDYLGRDLEAGNTFNAAMTDFSTLVAHAVLLAYDFSDTGWLVDVGGGCGGLLTTIMRMYPAMHGTLFDTPAVIAAADGHLEAAPGADRRSLVPGNFLEAVPPGADAYLMSGVVHDWDDERAVRILANCRASMARTGRVLVVECVVPDGDENSFTKLLDLNMLVMNGGRERTKAEFQRLFAAAGLRMTRVIPTLSPLSIVEGALP